MQEPEAKKKFQFDEIDLNDPATRAMYDVFGGEKEDLFVEAYFHYKYYTEWMSLTQNMALKDRVPLTKEVKEFLERRPDIAELAKKAFQNSLETNKRGIEYSPINLKVLNLENAVKLVNQKVDVCVEVPKSILSFEQARKIVLTSPLPIALGKCPCRMVQPEPCKIVPYPYEVCLGIGVVADFVAEQSPDVYRKVSREEAVKVLQDAHEMGLVTNAVFREILGSRVYAICNCCECCCYAIKVHNMMTRKDAKRQTIQQSSGYVPEFGDECIGCGTCVERCQFHALKLNEDETRVECDYDRCMGCGACEAVCPTEAVTMRVEPAKGGILDIEEILKATKIP